jgi:hypothetical protein
MATPTVSHAFFEPLPDSEESGWLVQVALVGEGFVERAAPLVARLGDVVVEGLSTTGETGAVGFLSEEPPGGARLSVGYLDTGLAETDITYPSPPIS